MINSQRRHLLFSTRQGNQYFHPWGCWKAINLSLKIWPLTFRGSSREKHLNFGSYNHLGTSTVVSGIRMGVVCLMILLKNPRYDNDKLISCILIYMYYSYGL